MARVSKNLKVRHRAAAPTARVAQSYGCSSYEITGSPGAICPPGSANNPMTAPTVMSECPHPAPTTAAVSAPIARTVLPRKRTAVCRLVTGI